MRFKIGRRRRSKREREKVRSGVLDERSNEKQKEAAEARRRG
jgi:hypothetical protein